VKHFAGGGGGAKKAVDVPQEIAEAWLKVLDDDQPETFLVAIYTSTGKALELKCTGTEGLAAFKAELPEDQVAWGGFKCLAVDDRGNVICKRPKFVFVQHMPAAASAMKKAKMATHKGAVKSALHSVHLDVSIEDVATELVETPLVAKLQAATGAHKPNGYEFETGVFVADDYYGLGIGKNCKAESATAT